MYDLCDCGIEMIVGFGFVIDFVVSVGMGVVFLYLYVLVCKVVEMVFEVVYVMYVEVFCC